MIDYPKPHFEYQRNILLPEFDQSRHILPCDECPEASLQKETTTTNIRSSLFEKFSSLRFPSSTIFWNLLQIRLVSVLSRLAV